LAETDRTYVPTSSGFLSLAVVLDAISRRIVGWAMAGHLRTEPLLGALNMALEQRRPEGVIHHPDHGCQYTALAFGKRCKEMGVRPSRETVGDAYDNALAEISSPPWNASSSSGGASGLRPRRAWPSFVSSKAGTIRTAGTPHSANGPRLTMGERYKLRLDSQAPTVQRNEATS
jgi:hypothetical protein